MEYFHMMTILHTDCPPSNYIFHPLLNIATVIIPVHLFQRYLMCLQYHSSTGMKDIAAYVDHLFASKPLRFESDILFRFVGERAVVQIPTISCLCLYSYRCVRL